MLVTGFKSFAEIDLKTMWNLPQGIAFDNYIEAFTKLKPFLLNSFIMVIPAALISSMIGSINGYVFAKWKFPGSDIIYPFILFGMLIPFQAILIPLVQFMNWIVVSGLPGLAMAHIIYGIPITTLTFRNYYATMPQELLEAGKLDGADMLGIYRHILLPMRRHLPQSVYDLNRWKSVVGAEWWPHGAYVLNRGGRFQEYEKAYKDGQLTNKYGKLVGIYFDKMVATKNSMTGKPYVGHAYFMDSPLDCLGNKLDDEAKGFDLTLITYRHIAQCKSRTSGNYWLQALYPENFIDISQVDAKRLGLRDGARVKVTSVTNEQGVWDLGHGRQKPMVGKVKITQGMRPGVVALWWR